jgi:TPR repeat protein
VAAAAAGDPDALYHMGLEMSDAGTDPQQARALLTAAAEGGSFAAQYVLGEMLLSGRGCADGTRDVAAQGCQRAQRAMASIASSRGETALAFAWVLRAAEQRADPDVLYRVGMAYLLGQGGAARDDEAARSWLREAAEMGHPRAQATFGQLASERARATGDGAAAVEAEAWLQRAGGQGERDAAWSLVRLRAARGDCSGAYRAAQGWVRWWWRARGASKHA